MDAPADSQPLEALDQWDDFVRSRYSTDKKQEDFRQHENAPPGVREFYRVNHSLQTLDFVRARKREYLPLRKTRMGIWEAMDRLNEFVDDSDPDTDLSQIEHNFQTAEAARRDGRPRWFILAGLVHDLGKVLCLHGEPQWAIVGDTFPLGCAFSDKVVYPDFFAANPDSAIPAYQTRLGIYEEGCGLENIELSWGHDEYMYQVAKPYLSEEALAMIRYHSFYPLHQEGAYTWLLSERDRLLLYWVKEFSRYDLYSKSHERPDVAAVRPYYEELVAEYFPPEIQW